MTSKPSGRWPRAVRRVGRTLVRHHCGAAPNHPPRLPQAARPRDPAHLRRSAARQHRRPLGPRVACRAGGGGLGPKRAGKRERCSAWCSPQRSRAASSAATWSPGSGRRRSNGPKCASSTPAQVEALAEAIDSRSATLIRFGAHSGLRPSELNALKVDRLDLLRATVRVVEAATEVDGHLHWGGSRTMRPAPCGCPVRSLTTWAAT
jgi:integrase